MSRYKQAALGMVAAFTAALEHHDADEMAKAAAEQFDALMHGLTAEQIVVGLTDFAMDLLFDHRERSGDLPEDILQRVALRLAEDDHPDD